MAPDRIVHFVNMPVGPAAAAISLGFQMTCCWHFHVVKQTHEVAAEASFAELHHLQILSALLFERWQGCFASVSLHAVRIFRVKDLRARKNLRAMALLSCRTSEFYVPPRPLCRHDL